MFGHNKKTEHMHDPKLSEQLDRVLARIRVQNQELQEIVSELKEMETGK